MTDPEKRGKRLRTILKPPKKIADMTDEERTAFARQIFQAASAPTEDSASEHEHD
jgi:hypothetical protein